VNGDAHLSLVRFGAHDYTLTLQMNRLARFGVFRSQAKADRFSWGKGGVCVQFQECSRGADVAGLPSAASELDGQCEPITPRLASISGKV
jgi:hypothetical protein